MFSCPEIHIRKPFVPMLADVWSSGVVLYYILTGEFPFNNINNLQLIKSIIKSEYFIPENISKSFLDLFSNLLDYREDKRFKLEEIYETEIFKSKNIQKPSLPLGYNIPAIKEVLNMCKINYDIKPIMTEKNLKEFTFDRFSSLYKQVINHIRKDKKDFGMKENKDEENLLKQNLEQYITQQGDNANKNKEKEAKILNNQRAILKGLENVKVKYLLYKKNKEVAATKTAEKNKNDQNNNNTNNTNNSNSINNNTKKKQNKRFPRFFTDKNIISNAKKRNSVCFIQPKEFGNLSTKKVNSSQKKDASSKLRKISADIEEIIEEEEYLVNPKMVAKNELQQQVYVRQIKDDIKKEKEKEKELEQKRNREAMRLQHMNNKNKYSNKKVRNIDEEIKKAKIDKIRSLEKKK